MNKKLPSTMFSFKNRTFSYCIFESNLVNMEIKRIDIDLLIESQEKYPTIIFFERVK